MTLVEQTEVGMAEMSEAAAREVTDLIQRTGSILWGQIVRAFQGRAWVALGYLSWDEYCDAEFDGARIKLPREERTMVVGSLADAGMSTRAIAAATGLGHGTVARTLAEAPVPNGTPEPEAPVDAYADDPDRCDVPGHGWHNGMPCSVKEPDAWAAWPAARDDDIVDAEIVEPTPQPEPRKVTGLDGKTYTRPEPKTPTPAEQRDIDLAEADARIARYVQKAISNWPALYGLRTHPRRQQILAHLCESDLTYLTDIEGKLQ